MLSQLFATHQKLKSLRFKQFHFLFVNSKIWKETSESRNFAAIKQFNKMKKKFIILPVVAMLMVCGFSACSQDDDLLEYDLGNDEVATLAKRSMPRNGETTNPSQPQNPKREYDEREVNFKVVQEIEGARYDGLTVTVRFSFIRNKDGVPTEAEFEYYYYPQPDFSIEDFSLENGVVAGHYTVVCKGMDNYEGVEYVGYGEAIL